MALNVMKKIESWFDKYYINDTIESTLFQFRLPNENLMDELFGEIIF